jgi:hypothetical protein
METNAFFSLILTIYSKLKSTNFSQILNEFFADCQIYLNPTSSKITNEKKSATFTHIIKLQKDIGKIQLSLIPLNISIDEEKILDSFSIYALFGEVGVNKISGIVGEIQKQNTNALNGLVQYREELNKLTQLCESLNHYQSNLQVIAPVYKENQIIIYFQDKVLIDDLKGLSKVSKKWDQILYGFVRLTKQTDTSYKIVSVKQGSLVLTITSIANVVKAVGEAVNLILELINMRLKQRRLITEIMNLKSSDIENESDSILKKSKINVKKDSEPIIKELLKKYEINETESEGDIKNAISFAVIKIMEFTTKGGMVDIRYVVDKNEGKSEINNFDLSIKFREKKELTNQINNLLETKDFLELTDGTNKKEDDDDSEESSNNDTPASQE